MKANFTIEPTVVEVEGMRLYNGHYPSVTTVLDVLQKPFFESYKEKLTAREREAFETKRDNAAALGTRVHSVCEKIIHGKPVGKQAANVRKMADAFEQFLEKYVDEVIATELALTTDLRGGFAGRADLIVKLVTGERALVDLKTSAVLTRENDVQTAGYSILAEDNGHGPIDKRLVVRLKKEASALGKYYVRDPEKLAQRNISDHEVFMACLDLLYWERGGKIDSIRKANLAKKG